MFLTFYMYINIFIEIFIRKDAYMDARATANIFQRLSDAATAIISAITLDWIGQINLFPTGDRPF